MRLKGCEPVPLLPSFRDEEVGQAPQIVWAGPCSGPEAVTSLPSASGTRWIMSRCGELERRPHPQGFFSACIYSKLPELFVDMVSDFTLSEC